MATNFNRTARRYLGTPLGHATGDFSRDLLTTDKVSTKAEWEVDVTHPLCWTSGTTLANLIQSPSSGASQTDYDFTEIGAGALTYPTANDPSGYITFDGTNSLQVASNTTFTESMHKDTSSGSNSFTIGMLVYRASSASGCALLATTTSTTAGVEVVTCVGGTLAHRIRVLGSSDFTHTSGLTVNTGTWEVLWIETSFAPGVNQAALATKLNNVQTYTQFTGGSTANAADGLLTIGSRPDGTIPMLSGSRFKWMGMYKGKLTATEEERITRLIMSRHGLTVSGYTQQ